MDFRLTEELTTNKGLVLMIILLHLNRCEGGKALFFRQPYLATIISQKRAMAGAIAVRAASLTKGTAGAQPRKKEVSVVRARRVEELGKKLFYISSKI
jgi:hypothetical protein